MKFVKKYLKIFTSNLENASLRKWRAADLNRRMAAAQILSASDANLDLLVKCVDKIATLPESGDMMVRDAVTLCNMGIIMNENN